MIGRNYILKVWSSTIVGAPTLMMLLSTIILARQGDKMDTGAFGFITFAFGYGLLLSVPTFLIIYFLFPTVYRKFESPIQLKLVLNIISIACIWLTFYLLYGGDGYDLNGNYAALSFSVIYTICLTLFSFIYSIQTQEHSR